MNIAGIDLRCGFYLAVKRLLLAAGLLAFILLVFLPPPAGLDQSGARALAVFALCIALWVTGYLPLAVTSILGMALTPLLGILDAREAFALFGDRAVFFILGALMIAAALYRTGLGARIAFLLLVRFNHKPRHIILGIMLSAAALSCIMPEHAVAAMLFPIVLEIARSMNLEPGRSAFGRALFIALAWGAIIGGITTYLGGARNLLAVGLLERNYGLTIDFFEWIKYALPIPVVIITCAYFLLLRFFPPEMDDASAAFRALQEKIAALGPPGGKEKRLAFVVFAVIVMWLFFSGAVHISVTALLGGVAVFVFRIIDWQDLAEYVNWGVILMYGGAMVVATALTLSGASLWFAQKMLAGAHLSPLLFLVFIALLTKLLTEGISNVAAVAIVLPVAFSLGAVSGIDPVMTTLTVALSGGLAFCLPMGTPPNAIAFASGYYRITEVARAGIILNLLSVVVIVLVALFYWPLVGLAVF